MNDLHVEKNDLRKLFAENRARMDQQTLELKSSEILEHFCALEEYKESFCIHTFIGNLPGEVLTHDLIIRALSQGKMILVPIYKGNDAAPSHSELHNIDDLEQTVFGLLEPAENLIIPAKAGDAELIVVPCLAVDRNGNRLGMGGGFYDKFLSTVDAVKVALTFDFQFIDELPSGEHDFKIDIVVTESGIKKIEK